MKYYLAQSTATDGTYVRWVTSRPTNPALDYVRTATMPSVSQLGNIRIILLSDSNRLSEGRTYVWADDSNPDGSISIYPSLMGAVEDELFQASSPASNTLSVEVKDTSLYTKIIVSPTSDTLFKGVI